jgi:hypothetical protein
METVKPAVYSHDLVEAGIDWITATRPAGDEAYQFEQAAEDMLSEQREEGRSVSRATLRDYTGWRGESLFVGTRDQDSIIVASADVAARHWATVAHHARNVSRLDLQVSVWTHGEQPPLARAGYNRLKRLPPKRGRPRSFSLIRTHPRGETLNVGKRQSDAYGRLYDWSSAHKQATAATIWRYEVEFKRDYALGCARTLLSVDDDRAAISHLVHDWWRSRGVEPTWSATGTRLSNGHALEKPATDPLAWFRSSLSKTIAKQIKLHGLDQVLDALGLTSLVVSKRRRCKDAT